MWIAIGILIGWFGLCLLWYLIVFLTGWGDPVGLSWAMRRDLRSWERDKNDEQRRLEASPADGDKDALFELSKGYMREYSAPARGIDDEERDVRMAEFLNMAAELEHAEAQCLLGSMYIHGISRAIGQDKHKGVEWYRKAAEQGDADAQFSLGTWYLLGDMGLDKDEGEGIKWYRKAAEQHFEKVRIALEGGSGPFTDEL
jgi:TPR repeat protein